MASKTANLTIKIATDAAGAQKGLDQTASGVDKFAKGVNKAAPYAAGALIAVGVAAKGAVDSASHLEQAYGGVDAVFGKSAKSVKNFANESADAVGLAKSQYADLATVIGSQLKNAGTPIDELAGKTNDLITTGADLAATFGGSTSDAVSALSSALKGEMDPIEKYGISLNQAAIQAQMVADGTDTLTGSQAAAAKQTAILELITKQGADSQGQYADQLDTTAEQQQRANAKFEDAKAALGEALLPAVTAVADALADFADWVSKNTTLVTAIVVVVGAFAVAIVAISTAMKVASVMTWLFNTALFASPITWIVIGVVALIAAIVLLWNKCDAFRNFFLNMWEDIKKAIDAVKSAFDKVLNVVKDIIDWIKNIKVPEIKLPWQKSEPAPSTATQSPTLTRALGGPQAVASLRSSSGPTFVIQGALDPVAVARQIRTILRADDRRRGGVVIGASA